MKLEQLRWEKSGGWQGAVPGKMGGADLVILFGGTSVLTEKKWFDEVKKAYPKAHVFGCSTAGEICGTRVYDDSLVAGATPTSVDASDTSRRLWICQG